MNPAKRKKLYRAELAKQKQVVETVKPVVVEVVKPKEAAVVQEPAPVVQETALEMGLKVVDDTVGVELTDNKKDKKKKSSQE